MTDLTAVLNGRWDTPELATARDRIRRLSLELARSHSRAAADMKWIEEVKKLRDAAVPVETAITAWIRAEGTVACDEAKAEMNRCLNIFFTFATNWLVQREIEYPDALNARPSE